MATDGRHLYYNPDFVNGLTPAQRIGVVCHECLHPAHAHQARRCGRDHAAFNAACDRAINPILRDAGYELPPGALYPKDIGMEDGKAAESYYKAPEPSDEKGKPGDDPGGCGGILDAGDPSECEASEAEYKVKVAQAAGAAKQRGTLPAALGGLIDSILDPEVPWQQILAEFVSRSVEARDDYSWEFPAREYIRQGLYLPSLHSEGLGRILVHIDISGSTTPYRAKFAGELGGVLDCKPCALTMVYGDTEVKLVEEWTPQDGEIEVKMPDDGGGTCHNHAVDYIRDLEDAPDCAIFLTDGYTSVKNEPPGCPVLWVVTPGGRTDFPFGRVIEMKD